MKKILWLFFHPLFEESKANKILLQNSTIENEVTFCDMYECYPDFNIDVQKEQSLLLSHDIVVFQHPFYWYSCPPLMKQWIDLVLEYGWAYGVNGNQLEGKYFFQVITSGGGEEAYQALGHNKYSYRTFLRPFEQTARLCKMTYLPPFIVSKATKRTDEELRQMGLSLAIYIKQFKEGKLPDYNDNDLLLTIQQN